MRGTHTAERTKLTVSTSESVQTAGTPPSEKRRGQSVLRIAAGALGGLLLLFVLVCAVLPSIVFTCVICRHVDYRGEETSEFPLQGVYEPEEFSLEATETFLTTSDGLRLWCAEVEAADPKGIVILLSGIDQPSVTCWYGEAAVLRENGYASLLLELRAHGQSGGDRIGFGFTEVEDVRAAVEYIQSQPEYADTPILIQGVSMGGAVALNAFGQLPELDGCLAMSAYASLEDEIDLYMERLGLPKWLREIELFFGEIAVRVYYGADAVETLRPERQIQNADGRPVLLMACTGDESVPVKNTYLLSDANPDAEVWIRDSWEHFILQNCDFRLVAEDTEFCARTLAFFDNCVETAVRESAA